jgi:hypothetical protein
MRNSALSQLSSTFFHSCGFLEYLRRAVCRSGLGKLSDPLSHSPQLVRNLAELFHLAEQSRTRKLSIKHHSGCACGKQRFGVLLLMIVRGERKRNKQRRHPGGCNLIDATRSRSPDHKIGAAERFGHISDERHDFAVNAGISELTCQCLMLCGSALVNYSNGRIGGTK